MVERAQKTVVRVLKLVLARRKVMVVVLAVEPWRNPISLFRMVLVRDSSK
jgi:hypothetical protein